MNSDIYVNMMKEKLMTLEVSVIGKVIHLNLWLVCFSGIKTLNPIYLK